MRRSRSFSNIPLPKFRRNASSENLSSQQGVRTSQQGVRTSQQGLRRSVSSSNLLSVPRIVYDSRNDLNRENNDPPASTSKNANRRITGTPLRSTGYSSVCRRITATPLSNCKSAPSPATFLKTSLINDKKFSSDQFRKICAFVEEKLEDFDPKSLKPLTLSMFVQTMSLLFQEIDPRIKINMQNYKEVVFKYLKLYKYPGPVSMSLLKSVNTNISWAQVMSIFGWLVDKIRDITSLSNANLLEKYIIDRAKDTCQSGTETKGLFIEYIEQLLNFDKAEHDSLKNEVEALRPEAEKKRIFISEQKEKKRLLSEKLEKMKLEMREFKESNIEAQINIETSRLHSEYESIARELVNMKQTITQIRMTISNQKYSLEEKKGLLKKFEDEKYSVALREEEIQNMLKLKDDYAQKQTNYRRQIEKEIHVINGKLLQLNLSNFIDARKIRLPDFSMGGPKFLEEIEERKQLLITIADKVNVEADELQKKVSITDNQFKLLCDDVEKMENDNDELKQEIEKMNVEISRVLFECEVCMKQKENKMKNLTETAPDVEYVKEKQIELQKEILVLREKYNLRAKHIIELCKKMHADASKNAVRMRDIQTNLAEKALRALEKKVRQKKIIADKLYDVVNE